MSQKLELERIEADRRRSVGDASKDDALLAGGSESDAKLVARSRSTPKRPGALLALLAILENIDEEFPAMDDSLPEPVALPTPHVL
jgi:hypothetical protein